MYCGEPRLLVSLFFRVPTLRLVDIENTRVLSSPLVLVQSNSLERRTRRRETSRVREDRGWGGKDGGGIHQRLKEL